MHACCARSLGLIKEYRCSVIAFLCLEKGMSGKGGARHFSKPVVNQGLLYKVFSEHQELVVDLKGYEILSRNSAINGKAMRRALPLIQALVELEPSAEIHAHAARNSLMKLTTEVPNLNLLSLMDQSM